MSAFADRRTIARRLIIAGVFAVARAGATLAQSQDDHDAMSDSMVHAEATSQTSSTTHVAPPPPEHPMEPMSGQQMIDAMDMDDAAPIATFNVDRLERFDGDDGAGTSWKAAASFGGDFDKLWLRSEGDATRGSVDRADAEALWGHAVAPFWDAQLGVRHDFGRGPDRNWVAIGVQGLAPYWFEVGATAYVGDAGRTAVRLELDYDVALTQRWVLQPRVEVNAYGRADPAAGIGSGVSDAELGLRLRYEIAREFAPYIGVERVRHFGETDALMQADGVDASETRWVIGLRMWY